MVGLYVWCDVCGMFGVCDRECLCVCGVCVCCVSLRLVFLLCLSPGVCVVGDM